MRKPLSVELVLSLAVSLALPFAGIATAQEAGPAAPSPQPKERDYWKANAQGGILWLEGNSHQLALSGLSESELNDTGLNFLRTQLVTVPGASIPNIRTAAGSAR